MRKIKSILSVIVVMAIVLGTMAVSADFSDVSSDKAYYQPVGILNAFGIITGYEDGTFGPEKDVTRAEFSAMLMRALASGGIGSADPSGMPFTDLGGATWAISDIRTAYDLKIVNGTSETTFAPLDNVTYEQALKMIVCALNYGAEAEQTQASVSDQPWYYGYMQVAYSLKLTNGITVSYGTPAKRWEIAQMIYNALEVEMLEKVEISGGVMYQKSEQTLLKDKLGYTKSRGEIYADGTNTISPDGKAARDGYALISDTSDGKVYTIAKGKVSLTGLLGKQGDYYYKTDEVGEARRHKARQNQGDEHGQHQTDGVARAGRPEDAPEEVRQGELHGGAAVEVVDLVLHAQGDGEDGVGIGAQQHEARLAQGEEARKAVEQVHGHRHERVDGGLLQHHEELARGQQDAGNAGEPQVQVLQHHDECQEKHDAQQRLPGARAFRFVFQHVRTSLRPCP